MRAVYKRQLTGYGAWLGEEDVELEFTATQSGDTVTISFTDETKLRLYALRLTPDEIVGCDETATDAFWESEREECRVANVRQRSDAPTALSTDEQTLLVAMMALDRLARKVSAA